MWMLRLLSPTTTETPPGKVIEPGRNKILLKPSAALPPSNVNAKEIVGKFEGTIRTLHEATGGQLELLHFILSCISDANARPPPPPSVIIALLGLEKEDLSQPNVRVSFEQLLLAFEKLVTPNDSEENFELKIISVIEGQIKRHRHASVEIQKLRAPFKELHAACGGKTLGLYNFFMELLPIEHRGQYNLAMWTAMVMKLPPGTETIDLEHFTVHFRDSMDTTDTAESIIPKVELHIGVNSDPAKRKAWEEETQKAAAEAQARQAHEQEQESPRGPTEHQVKIVEAFAADIRALHESCAGRVSVLHEAFCAVAQANGRPRLPPPAMGALLELTQEDMRKAPVSASLPQLVSALQKMVKADETEDTFKTKVITVVEGCTRKAAHATTQIAKLRPALSELHSACGGAAQALFHFFMDLVPEEQRPGLSLEQWNGMVMKVHPKSDKIPLDHFMFSFQDSMDESDDADNILPVLEKHIATLTASQGGAEAEDAEE